MQALFLDAFSANCVYDFAKTLSFCLEFWVFSLSCWVFSWIFSKKPISPLKNWQLLQYFYVDLVFYANFNHFSVFSPIHPLILVIFCCSLIKFCRNLEFFAWVLSYFYEAWVFSSLSFFQTVQKKPVLNTFQFILKLCLYSFSTAVWRALERQVRIRTRERIRCWFQGEVWEATAIGSR